jgi:hypothetical protein
MANIDRGTRLTWAQLKAQLDGVAHAAQHLADAVGDDFTSWITSGYSDNTVMRGVDMAIDGGTTGLMGLTSVDALSRLAPPLHAMRKNITNQTNAGTTAAMVALGYGELVKSLMSTFASGYDDTYSNFWSAIAALYTPGQYIPGEVVDIMHAVGIKTDPAYCYPPEHKYLALIDFTGAGTATLTTKDEIDPLLYHAQATANVEWYVVARDGTPTQIDITMAAGRDEDDTPTDTGATSFTLSVLVGAGAGGTVTDTGPLVQASSKIFCSSRDSTLTITGGEDLDSIAIRVKTLRAMAFPT